MLGYISVAVSFLFLQFSWLSLYLSLGFWLSSQFCGFWESSWNLSIRYMLGKESINFNIYYNSFFYCRLVNGIVNIDSCTRSLLMTWRSTILKISTFITKPLHDVWISFWNSSFAAIIFMLLSFIFVPLIVSFYAFYLAVQVVLFPIFLVAVLPTSILIWTLLLLHNIQIRY